jgi:hypothetical protein
MVTGIAAAVLALSACGIAAGSVTSNLKEEANGHGH